ncbi:MAG: MFS transporter [Anaerolineae bacterium]|nr:MFS transporter [Anaerolineae bacterium]
MSESSVGRVALPHVADLGSRRLTIGLYSVIVFLYWLALYLYVPTLPTYTQSKTENLALVGVVLSMYGLWQAAIRLPIGIAADWLGWRKPFIVMGIILAGLGAWVMGIAGDVNGLLLGRAITGLGAGTWVPLIAAFSGLFPPQDAVRATAILNLVGQVGRISATSLTGPLNQMGGYSLAFFLAAGAAALAILAVLAVPEKRRPAQRPSLGHLGRLITRQDVLLPALLALVSQYANWAATFGFLPVLGKQLGATDVTQSLMVSVNIAVLMLGNLATTAIVKRTGARPLAYLSFAFLSAGIIAAALAPSLPYLFISQICIGLSQGIGGPVLMGMSIRYVVDAERTTAMGLHQAVYAIGMFAGPGLSGVLAESIGIRLMFGMTAFACLVLGLLGSRLLVEKGQEV